MGWRKLGLVFAGPGAAHPGPVNPALISHAALPVPFPLGGDLVRVFYSGRNAQNRSAVGSVVLRLGERPVLEEASPTPLLLPGPTGAFDDAGVGIGSITTDEAGERLYYMGWNVGGAVPWRNAIGVAFGDARRGVFERQFLGPVLDRSPLDPFSLSYPWVLRAGSDDWRMWYGTHLSWGEQQADMSHAIRVARSRDGFIWQPEPEICVPPAGREIATVRPSVLPRPGGGFTMCFAARGLDSPYRIHEAVSDDGTLWRRRGAALRPTEPWEGDALTYPAMFQQAGRTWLLFNGQRYGATGFGLAVRYDG